MSNIADSVLALINEENTYGDFLQKADELAKLLRDVVDTDNRGFATVTKIERVRKVRDAIIPFVDQLNAMLSAPETEKEFRNVIDGYKHAIGGFFKELGYKVEEKDSYIEAVSKTQTGAGALIRVFFAHNDTIMTVKIMTSIDGINKDFNFNLQDTPDRIVNNVKEAIAEFNKNSVDPVI